MILPGLLAVLTPVVIGFLFGPQTLGGLLAGVTVTGVLMAIFQSNSGGAWDNAKKMIEEGVEIDGNQYGKGSDMHKAAVVGDTVGDPFKDTSGPSLNILIKLMSVVSLVIAPLIWLYREKKMRYYETVYIINPNFEQSRLDSITKEVEKQVSEFGKVISHNMWGKKKLAYQIDAQKYGTFVLLYFE